MQNLLPVGIVYPLLPERVLEQSKGFFIWMHMFIDSSKTMFALVH